MILQKLNLDANLKEKRNIDNSINGEIAGISKNNIKINNKIDYTKNINLTGTIPGIKVLKSKTNLSGDISSVKQNGAS